MPTWLFRPLSPGASHVAVATLAIATWVFVIVPLWSTYRPKLLVLGKSKSFRKRLAGAAVVFSAFALVLWAGRHKDVLTSHQERANVGATTPFDGFYAGSGMSPFATKA